MRIALMYYYEDGKVKTVFVYRYREGLERFKLPFRDLYFHLDEAWRFGDKVLLYFGELELEISGITDAAFLEVNFPPECDDDIIRLIVLGDCKGWKKVEENEVPKPVLEYLKGVSFEAFLGRECV